MLRRVLALVIIFTLAAVFVPQVSHAADPHVVINAFQISGAKSTDEFVELFNPTENKINLSGWRLSKKTSSGTVYTLLTTFPSIEIESGNFVVVAHQDFSGSSDLFYSTSSSIAEDNTIVLYSDAGKTVVDKVGFGKAGDFEGTAVANPAVGEIIKRKQNGVDTDNNAADFEKETEPPPDVGNPAASANVFITELMPNPTGSDTDGEWIELYNGGATIDLGGYILQDKIGSQKKYIISVGTKLENGKYVIFDSKTTGISLNNDGDIVELISPSGDLLDDSGASYGNAKEGYSYAYDGEQWVWTKTPTAGAQNLITTDEDTAKKAVTNKKTSKARKTAAAKKAKAPKAAKANILGAQAEGDDVFDEDGELRSSPQDRLLGYILIGVALFGGFFYTVYVNRGKLREVFIEEFGGYRKTWSKIREKLPWR